MFSSACCHDRDDDRDERVDAIDIVITGVVLCSCFLFMPTFYLYCGNPDCAFGTKVFVCGLSGTSAISLLGLHMWKYRRAMQHAQRASITLKEA